jgi:arginine exporter protein ArgO
VVVTGYSDTRDMISGLFHFAPATGSTLVQNDITVQLGSAFATWYGNPASNATGSQFTLTQPFTLSQGTAASITAVTVTLSNSQGASAPVSP